MISLQKRAITAIATGAILLNAFTPFAFADTTIEITGNGSSSDNNVNVAKNSNTTVVQNNTAIITNVVNSSAETGDNDANDNGGGDVVVKTGNANSTVDVSNAANINHANVDACDCDSNTTVNISGNLSNSNNTANLTQNSTTTVFQDNYALFTNSVNASADTGDNDANRNLGDVTVDTGKATSNVTINNMANVNKAIVGGGDDGGNNVSLWILGNGSGSDNDIRVRLNNQIAVVQTNFADILNVVNANAETGDNDANDNGGDVTVTTGNAWAGVDIDNMVNFNFADVDCECIADVTAKIAHNLSDSNSDIRARLDSDFTVFQDLNLAFLTNVAYADADTGDNDANRNIGGDLSDPSIDTGDATSNTEVENSGNVNIFGEDSHVDLPDDFDFDFDFDFHFDFSGLTGLVNNG